ncbi:hypothetical protein FGO68_gene3707 [Halteria grandinella]|uniref:Uncharacterized protein n=1 Tax=Halteria grandinella TaxID=5974 RepID=A0A8J8NMM9_HALGN|nr:hypothetical protein FGO68_gene3707 [Halteria grandinella]
MRPTKVLLRLPTAVLPGQPRSHPLLRQLQRRGISQPRDNTNHEARYAMQWNSTSAVHHSVTANMLSIQTEKNLPVDFERLLTVKEQFGNIRKRVTQHVAKLQTIEFLNEHQRVESIWKELLDIRYLENLSAEMIFENYKEVFIKSETLEVRNLLREEDALFFMEMKMKALQQQSKEQRELVISSKANSALLPLIHQELTKLRIQQESFLNEVTSLKQTVCALEQENTELKDEVRELKQKAEKSDKNLEMMIAEKAMNQPNQPMLEERLSRLESIIRQDFDYTLF